MSRELRFRAWDKMQKEMSRSLELDAIALQETETWFPSGMCHYNSLIFMQYTGLHDKNGKEIYEGDIVKRFTGYKYVVEIRGYSGYAKTDVYGYELHPEDEVIGNIYENPELLKPESAQCLR